MGRLKGVLGQRSEGQRLHKGLHNSMCAAMCTQIHSGGLLRATMHCVRGAAGPAAAGITRHSFALFMQPR